MKKIAFYLTAALLVLALLTTAAAEGDDPVKGIFDKLTAEGSFYSQMKEEYSQYFNGIAFAEVVGGDSFTIEITGDEAMQENNGMYLGKWTYQKNGDYLTVTFPETDFSGARLTVCVLQATADYYGLNSTLVTSYINGLAALGIESPAFKTEIDEAAKTQTMSIYIAGPFDMKELDQMVLTEDVLTTYGYDPLDENHISLAFNLGKISMLMNGSKDGVTILLQEYGDLDDVALNALKTVVNYMKPAGYEAFVSEYTALKDDSGEGWTVKLNPDEETVREIYPNPFEGYSRMVVRLGDQAASGSAEKETADDAPYGVSEPEAGKKFDSDWAIPGGLAQIFYEEEGYRVALEMDRTDGTGSLWQYSCYYHEDTDNLVSVASSRTDYTINPETGDKEYGEALYEGLDEENRSTEFSIDADGFLIWKDAHDDAGAGMKFTRIGQFDGVWRNEAEETEAEFMWNGLSEDEMFYTVYITRGKTGGDLYTIFLMNGTFDPATGKLTAEGTCTVYRKNAEGGYDSEEDGEMYDAVFSKTEDGRLLFETANGIELEYDIMGHHEG